MAILQFAGETARRLEAIYETADVRAQRTETLRRLALQPGERVLDLGCGHGLLTRAMADAVGPEGLALGVDVSAQLVAAAAQRAEGVPWLRFMRGDARDIPSAGAAFDALACIQTLEYVAPVEKALGEIARVLCPGGRLLVLSTDWDSIVWHARDEARMARILTAWEAHVVDPRLPRTLLPRLRAQGFRDLRVTAWPILNTRLHEQAYSRGLIEMIASFASERGLVRSEQVAAWVEELRELAQEDAYFMSLNRYLFEGRRPAA
ncbi:methyltransferase domain-containing protein [Geminicoccaceae bacterium 1502E]|nr:methyltransferase domain-containing protein [Geminicoccaceae bacterium 1502E]